jgi:hypothetical protein
MIKLSGRSAIFLTIMTFSHVGVNAQMTGGLSPIGKSTQVSPKVPLPQNPPTGLSSAPLKIVFTYVGPVGDGGWTFAHDNGRKAVKKEFGDKVVISFVEKDQFSVGVNSTISSLMKLGRLVKRCRGHVGSPVSAVIGRELLDVDSIDDMQQLTTMAKQKNQSVNWLGSLGSRLTYTVPATGRIVSMTSCRTSFQEGASAARKQWTLVSQTGEIPRVCL